MKITGLTGEPHATADVKKCRRCGRDHDGVPLARLSNPADQWAYWTLCHVTGEPLLVSILPPAANK